MYKPGERPKDAKTLTTSEDNIASSETPVST